MQRARENPSVPTYSLRKHRKGAAGALAIATVVGGAGAAVATLFSRSDESIDEYQVDATLEGDRLSIVETIDFDFGVNSRRGIIRDVDLGVIDRPDTVEIENITAATSTANDELQVTNGVAEASLRVGNPNVTFRGLHRYQLGYDLVGIPDPQEEGELVFVAIGDRWEVPIEDITVRVATDFEPDSVECTVGGRSDFSDCAASVDDGIVTAAVPKVDRGQGVVLGIGTGPAQAAPSLQPPPLDSGKSSDEWWTSAVVVGVAAALAGAAGSLLGGRWVRRVGADLTGAVANPSAAAYATGLAGVPVSDADAAKQVTVQFAPPEGLTPAQGAVLEREQIDDAAKTAWLAQAVIDGWIELEGDPTEPTMVHTARADRDPAHLPAPLGVAFDGRREVQLGRYDEHFAAAWQAIGGQLRAWRSSSGLWDERRGARNHSIALRWFGVALVAVVGVGIALVAGVGRTLWLATLLAVGAGLLFGGGLRAMSGTPTLSVRNPAGFGLWLRTEGFRRFLAESEGHHVRWAADHGVLREYSAWAVALGELDRWNRAAAAAGLPPTDPGLATTTAFVGLSTTAHTTSTPPSSHGDGTSGFSGSSFSGGGFSGGVGGGGGSSW